MHRAFQISDLMNQLFNGFAVPIVHSLSPFLHILIPELLSQWLFRGDRRLCSLQPCLCSWYRTTEKSCLRSTNGDPCPKSVRGSAMGNLSRLHRVSSHSNEYLTLRHLCFSCVDNGGIFSFNGQWPLWDQKVPL